MTHQTFGLACAVVVLISSAIGVARSSNVERFAPPLGLDEYFFTPDDNPLTAEKIELGRRLFFDRRLSADGRVSCASCHRPDRAFSSPTPQSSGVHGRKGTRNAPALVNRAYGRAFSLDGHSATLEQQVLRPFLRADELDIPLDVLTTRLQADTAYQESFARAFSEAPSPDDVARALASFVRAQRFGDAPFDRYQAGDSAALSTVAKLGLEIFRGRGNCVTCHPSPFFTDESFHNTGVSWGSPDLGRFGVTGHERDRGAFKTPTLRELARTAPYMHDGSLPTLSAVVDFYSEGGRANPFQDREVRPLRFTDDEKRHLVAFLFTLSSPR